MDKAKTKEWKKKAESFQFENPFRRIEIKKVEIALVMKTPSRFPSKINERRKLLNTFDLFFVCRFHRSGVTDRFKSEFPVRRFKAVLFDLPRRL